MARITLQRKSPWPSEFRGSFLGERANLGDRLLVVLEVHGVQAGSAGAFAVDEDVVDEEASARGFADALKGQLVDPRFGLATADEARVDDRLEDLVDG